MYWIPFTHASSGRMCIVSSSSSTVHTGRVVPSHSVWSSKITKDCEEDVGAGLFGEGSGFSGGSSESVAALLSKGEVGGLSI